MKNEGVPISHYIVFLGILGFFFIKAFVEPAIITAACDSVIICEDEQ